MWKQLSRAFVDFFIIFEAHQIESPRTSNKSELTWMVFQLDDDHFCICRIIKVDAICHH